MVSGAAHDKEVSPSVRGWRLILLGLLSPVVVVLIFGVVGDPQSPQAEAAGSGWYKPTPAHQLLP